VFVFEKLPRGRLRHPLEIEPVLLSPSLPMPTTRRPLVPIPVEICLLPGGFVYIFFNPISNLVLLIAPFILKTNLSFFSGLCRLRCLIRRGCRSCAAVEVHCPTAISLRCLPTPFPDLPVLGGTLRSSCIPPWWEI
jgi:hypothetical protein